jgi:hypothetical protein
VRVGNDKVEVIIQDVAEAFANWAGPMRVVERKKEWRRALKDAAARQA